MYGHGLGSYMEEISSWNVGSQVCVLVGWLGRPLHSFACKFCIGYDMMQYLLCRHRHRSVQAARVGWLKYTFVREKSCTSDKIEMKSCKFQETASPDVGVGWGNELDIRPDKCETAAVPLGITLYPYHGHHQTEIKHLSGHTFTRPRHWSLGTSG